MAPPLGKWLYPKSEQVAMRLILGGRVTFALGSVNQGKLVTEIKTNCQQVQHLPNMSYFNCSFNT